MYIKVIVKQLKINGFMILFNLDIFEKEVLTNEKVL